MNDTALTLVGALTADPALRFLTNGQALASFRVASTHRRYDRETDTWQDVDTTHMTVTCWRQLAENVAASLRAGDRVVAAGRLRQRAFDTGDGGRRVVYELDADAVGPDLGLTTVAVARLVREAGGDDTAFPAVGADLTGPDAGAERDDANDQEAVLATAAA